MPIAQGFVIASGLVLAVFGFLYFAWWSTSADRTASFLHAMFDVLSVSILAGIGTFFLLTQELNLMIGVGIAVGAYASAFKIGFMAWHRYLGRTPSDATFKAMFRCYSLGNLVAGCLCGIGLLAHGGAVRLLGMTLSTYWVVMHAWLLNRLRVRTEHRGQV